MERKEEISVWGAQEPGTFFILPPGFDFKAGTYRIHDFQGNEKAVDLSTISFYSSTKEEAYDQLNKQWRAAMNVASKSLQRLKTFSKINQPDTPTPDIDLSKLFKETTGTNIPPQGELLQQAQQILSKLESVNALPNDQPPEELKTLLANGTLPGMEGNIMDIMRNLAHQVDGDALKDDDTPAGWIKVLNQQFFGEEEKTKKEARKKQIRKEVDESIARALRARGIEPIDTSSSE